MSKKNKTYKVNEKKSNTDSLTLKGGYISVEIVNIHEHLQEVNRGCGIVKSKKTYNRKKNNRVENNYDCSFLILLKKQLKNNF